MNIVDDGVMAQVSLNKFVFGYSIKNSWTGAIEVSQDLIDSLEVEKCKSHLSQRERLRIAILSLLVKPIRDSVINYVRVREFRIYFEFYGPEAILIKTRTHLKTLLHIAVENGVVEMVEFLLAKGASIYERDIEGKTSLDIVPLCNASKIKRMLAWHKKKMFSMQVLHSVSVRLNQSLLCRRGLINYEDSNHVRRISQYVAVLSERLGLSQEQIKCMELVAARHDIGNRGLPGEVLLEPSKLSFPEKKIIQSHTIIGSNNFSGIDSPLLRQSRFASLCHHENWDGTGYPQGLIGDRIPLCAKIIRIADVFEALVKPKPYHNSWKSKDKVVNEMNASFGTIFDPKLMRPFNDVLSELFEINMSLVA